MRKHIPETFVIECDLCDEIYHSPTYTHPPRWGIITRNGAEVGDLCPKCTDRLTRYPAEKEDE